MASQLVARAKNPTSETTRRRNRLRTILLETLERRELLAGDLLAGPVFAPGTSPTYIDQVLEGFRTTSSGNQFNVNQARWTDPVGGSSPNEGDPANITWSIVPDGTQVRSGPSGQATSPSNLIAFMDSIYGRGGGGAINDRPWFHIFESAYDRWSEVSGITFTYEATDDGVDVGGANRGVAGIRGDVRIGGATIDGNFGTLAYNYYPSTGGNSGIDGEMTIDTNDSWYFTVADGAGGENRGLYNVLAHESGHGIGIGHSIPIDQTKLMEPNVSLAFSGVQHDDILGVQRLYGDARENDDTQGTATNLGELSNGVRRLAGGSIDQTSDEDWFAFSVPSSGRISLLLEPIGEQYSVGNQGGAASSVDTLRNQDLSLELRDSTGTVLALLNTTGAGAVEQLDDLDLPAGGSYTIRVFAQPGLLQPQLYDLTLRVSRLSGPNVVATPPRLLSLAPNIGEIFSFNRVNDLDIGPNQLTFRFDGAQFLDPSSLDGIRITRSGFDGDFTDGDEVTITPGFIGFGESERIIIARFAETLPDDLYKVEVFGVDVPGEGITAVRNVNGDALKPRVTGTDRDTLLFDLELGNQVVAIVPQPVTRNATTGAIEQARNKIEVYFGDGDRLSQVSATNRNFYQLYADRGTVSNTDDVRFLPTSVEYFPDRNVAVLDFTQNIDELDVSKDTSFRLRIGTNEAKPGVPVAINQPTDPGSTFAVAGASDLGILGMAGMISSLQVNESIRNASAFPLDFPGAPDMPGVREILDDPAIASNESHLLGDSPDSNTGLTVQQYNFNKVDPIAFSATGDPIPNVISPDQEQRAREVFEFYGSLLGIQFVETESSGWTIGTAEIDGTGGTLGVAGGGVARMDVAESWNDEFGVNDEPGKVSWFAVAMHEIGHLLGLGHSSELPPGSIMGGGYSDTVLGGEAALLSGNPVEPVFPGPTDLVSGKYLHRPDSRDIDIYKFEVAAGSSGEFTAEVIAERLPDSSLLDSVLTLYRERPDGSREVVAVNDDYFSEDSYLRLNLSPGVYFLGVSASGNTDYNPEIADSGLGGTTEGDYQLRTTFRPLVANSIVDTEGTPIDGNGDGIAGGVFNFWFNAGAPKGLETGQRRTLFVDNLPGTGGSGTMSDPYRTISEAFAAAQFGDIVRLVPNGGSDGNVASANDNFAFEVGTGGLGNQPLSDGTTMNVPRGVTVMVDAGVLFKMGRSVIGVGSSTGSGDRSQANLQILGTPEQDVIFTSYTDETLGVDTDPLTSTAGAGDWGGIIFRNALDRAEGRFDAELDGRFVNYVGFADMRYGGGQVPVDGSNQVITPLHMVAARPTLINNTITNSAAAAMSADPNSFQESTFAIPRFQAETQFTPGYTRVGPEIHGNHVTDNSINGMFVRVETLPGQSTTAQTVSARWDDRDIVHFLADTLTVAGTPGGPFLETTPPTLNVASISSGGNVSGGQLVPGVSYSYRMTFMDANGNEGVASAATLPFTLPAGANAIRLGNIPPASSQFVARNIYRSNNGGPFRLVAELDRSSTIYVDASAQRATQVPTASSVQRARLDASLVVDPGLVVKIQSGRIVAGISAQIVAEGTEGLPVTFTSRQDDRFGAGGTFDTNGDGAATAPQPGDWGGLYFGQMGSGSLDHALVTHAGGVTGVAGTFAGFNAIEIHQSDVRIANSIIERNASGLGNSSSNREGFGFNESAAIFSRGSEPIIVDNIIRNNDASAISIDPQSMSGNSVKDKGRITGLGDRRSQITENKGPLLRGNELGGNFVNAMVVRGATLGTESVWDDTDIVHALFDEILIPDLFVFGGLRLQSSPNESLVVKLGPGAGITSNGRPLDIDDRIGGSLQVVGTPGFPVVLTSIADDTIGAGFDPEGRAQTDTNNDGNGSAPSAGDWRSIRIDEFSNDRNVAIATELEPAQSTGAGANGVPTNAQYLGQLGRGEQANDNNLRLGFTVVGAINNIDDIDVYSFRGTAGTEVWFDIDRTNISLDSVVELIDSDGNIIAQSDNSLDESNGTLALFSDPAKIETTHVNPMANSLYHPRNAGGSLNNSFADFYSTNPLDAGMRVVLPGSAGSPDTFFVRVRSSNIDSRHAGANRADLQDPAKLANGKTEGQYQLQVRLRAMDEAAGSSVSYADVRYATNGIEVLGGPSHSPLVGEAVELTTNNNTIANALDLGNLLNTDRAALSIAGDLNSPNDVDWYQFEINQDSIQAEGLAQHLATIIDVDYADKFGRANTSLWLFYDDQNGLGSGSGIRLVNFGLDSNIADDIGAPLNGSDEDDLSRGSAGVLDAFIGSSALPSGTYYLAITANEQISAYLDQFYSSDAGGNPLTRVEPINSVTRLAEDRFGGSTNTAAAPLQVAFQGTNNQVPFSLADLPLFVTRRGTGSNQSQVLTISPALGTQTSLISQFAFVQDAAMRGDGRLHGAVSPQVGVINDGNSGGIIEIDTAGDGASNTVSATSGIQTFEVDFSTNPPSVQQALTPGTGGQRQGVGMEFLGLTYPQIGNQQALYAVGSRGYGATTFQSFFGASDARNYVYRLDPTSLTATSAPQGDRTNNARVQGAGTQIRERGYIDTSIDINQNATSQAITMSDASPFFEPALLSGDQITLNTPNGTTVFEWQATVLSATLIADTGPQTNRFVTPPDNYYRDGMTFSVTDATSTANFEIDTGTVLLNTFGDPGNGSYDEATFTLTDENNNTNTWEFDNNNDLQTAGAIRIAFDGNTTRDQMTILILNAINNAPASPAPPAGPSTGPWTISATLLPGFDGVNYTDRISLTGDRPGFGSSISISGDSSTQRNPLLHDHSIVNKFGTLGAGETYDGSTFTVTDSNLGSITFEFDTAPANAPSIVPGRSRIGILASDTRADITQKIISAINSPDPAVVFALPGSVWTASAAQHLTSNLVTLSNYRGLTASPETATLKNPVRVAGNHGTLTAATPVLIEEFYVNLDDNQVAPQPSTPGAMDELISAINGVGGGFTVNASQVGSRLVLNNATAADFLETPPVLLNTVSGTPGVVPLPFTFNQNSIQLNTTLYNAILPFEPGAIRMTDGYIWVPGQSSFIQAGTNDRLDPTAYNAKLSAPQYGYVTGLGFAGNAMYGVSENGDLYRVGGSTFFPTSTGNDGDFIETIYNPNTRSRVQFTSLDSGPLNVQGGALANILFGIDTAGVLYAFDTLGRPANVFNNGEWFVQTDGSGSPSGLAFTNLDVNLWHTTSNNRNNDPGHGVNVSFDGSRRTQDPGGNSLYFGFENPNDPSRQIGNWSGVNDPGAAFYDTYNFPGGTAGSIVSNTLDLSDYSPADKPTMYFNYYLETENANADDPTDNNFMKDALRVFVAGEDGNWKLVASNNSTFDANRLDSPPDDEYDYPFDELAPGEALTRQVSELFDAGVNGAPDSWRQARVDLSRFAGEEIVRIRFDFSTAGNMFEGTTGGVELVAVAGDKIREGQTFVINGGAGNRTFEFDLGLVLQIPSGGRLSNGQTFVVNGVTYTFAGNNTGNNVLFAPTDSAETIAARIVAKLQLAGLNATIDPRAPSRIAVMDATSGSAGAGLPANFVSDTPGVAFGNVQVLVNNAMTANEVRDAIRTSLAATFNAAGQEGNLDVIQFHDSSIFLYGKTVVNPGPLGLSSSLQGDVFGERNSGATNSQVGLGAQRGQNNNFEGVYIDDIVIGFAERGEMVTYQDNATATTTTFVPNPRHEPAPGTEEIETGSYQIEIRRAATYAGGEEPFPSAGLGISFDTNDRHTQQVSLIAPAGAELSDGQTFQLSDGVNTVTYEYDDTSITAGPNAGVAQGNIRVAFSSLDDADTVARSIRDAINSSQSRAKLDIVAGLSDGTATGTGTLGKTTGSRVIHLHGNISVSRTGSNAFDGVQQSTIAGANMAGFVLYGLDFFKLTENGDANRQRDQGQIIVHSNIIRDSSGYGIVVDAGARVNNSLIPLAGALAHPGSVRNLVQFNSTDLIPGPVLINNLVYANAVGGILFSGDNRSANTPEAPRPFGRIVNNTVVGNNGSGVGIDVSDFASPTLLNNIVAGLSTGIRVSGNSSTTVVGATTYQNNGSNATGPTGVGTDPQLLGPSEPLFVNAAGRNYYLADGTRAIDAAIDTLNDRQQMTTIRTPLGIAVSPILAPDADLTGQLRVDIPGVSNPNGTGGNPFKDRGAYDRADFFGPVARIQQPLDNDPDRNDIDRTNTYIQLQATNFEPLDFFSVLLFEDEGTGPDALTVTEQSVTLTENGRLLQPGVDYIFGYNPSSRLIRLTPLAGIWRNDSIYEITLNNRDGIQATAPTGASVADGDSFTISAGATTLTFEFDNNASVASGSIAVPFKQDYTQYQMAAQLLSVINAAGNGLSAYLQGDRGVMINGATSVGGLATTSVGAIRDVAGNALQANRVTSLTQFTIVMPEVTLDFGDAPGANHRTVTTGLNPANNIVERYIDASRHGILPIDAPLLVLGTHVDGDADGQPNAAATGDDVATTSVTTTIPGAVVSISGGARLLASPATAAFDGKLITISDPIFQTVTFEFDTAPNPGTVQPGNIRIPVIVGESAVSVATKIRDAVNKAVLDGHIEGLNAFSSGATVDLGGTSGHTFDLTAALPAVQRIPQSDYTLALPATGFADGHLVSVTDTQGRNVLFELDFFTLPTDPATVTAPNVRVAVPTGATPTEIATAFTDAINGEIAERRLTLAPVTNNGLTLVISGDDEDGVSFGGLFNAQSKAVPVTVTATGSGLLDVWFDWNGDGDFDDAGERIDLDGDTNNGRVQTTLPIDTGTTTLLITTPQIAQTTAEAYQLANPGERFFIASRFRVSTNGSATLGGVGIGGEVEDHLVEIVVGAPPVAVNDSYDVLEDQMLTVSAAGILSNDTDPDTPNSGLEVADEDPSTPATLEPVKDVEHGVLTLNRDGSFVYTPNRDFNGEDTFVYNVTDPRLLSLLPATVTITVHQVNDAPTANDDTLTIHEDETVRIPFSQFTLNDFAGEEGFDSQFNELDQSLTILNPIILSPNPSTFGGSVTVDSGFVVITPGPNYNREIDGPFVLQLTVQDNGKTANPSNGYALEDDFLTDTSIVTIDVLALNDSPEFVMPQTYGLDEDAGPQTVNPFITSITPGPGTATDEATGPAINFEDQSVTFTATALNPIANLFKTGPSIDANGILTFELNPDVTSVTPFPAEILVEVIATDDHAPVGETILTNRFDPTLIAAGNLKTYDGATLTVTDLEGNTVVFELDDVDFPGVGSTNGVPHVAIGFDATTDTQATISNKLAASITAPPAASIATGGAGDWAVKAFVDSVNGEIRLVGDASVASATATTNLTNVFTALAAGETYDGSTFTLTDVSGDAVTFEFNDTALGTPVAAGNVAINYNTGFTQNELSQAISDAINNLSVSVRAQLSGTWDISSTLPAASNQLELSGLADIALSASASPVINPLALQDSTRLSPIASRQANNSTARTLTIVPAAINDEPEFTITQDVTVNEDAGVVVIPGFIDGARPGPMTALDELAAQGITFTLTANQPNAFYNFDNSLPGPNGLPTLTLNATTGAWDLTFQTGTDVNDDTGHDLGVMVTLMDDGGVRPGTLDDDTAVNSFAITVNPINDAPTFVTDPTYTQTDGSVVVTVLEDNEDFPPPGATPTVIPGFALFTVGPTTAIDETTAQGPPAQTAVFSTLSVSNPGLFEVTPIIDAAGDLVFTTADNQNGSSVVVVRMTDTGVGLETGQGDDNQARPDRTFTITLTPVNDHPEFDIALTADSIEDQGLVQIPGFLTNLRNGPLSAADESGQEFSVHVEAVDPTVVFTVPPEIAADGTLRYQTGPNVNNNNSNLLVRVWLTDDGAQGPAPNNHISPEQTFLLNVTPVNDAPSFSLPSTSVTVDEDSGTYSNGSFATGIQVGPATATDEALGSTADPSLGRTTLPPQTAAFEVVSVSAPELFSAQPSISPAGTLTFTPGLHKNGNAVVVVRLVDSGPSAPPPNDNDSSLQTFTIAITPVNDAPVFDLPPSRNITVNEDAGLVSQNGFATNVRRGPVGTDDENNQTIRFEVSAVNPALFTVQPSIGVDGTLVFQTAPNVNTLNANGQLLVDVKLIDSGLSTPPPNDNESDAQQFTITVTPVNDDPIPNAFSASTTEDTPITLTAVEVISDDPAGPTSDETDGSQSLRMSQIQRTSVKGGVITPVFSGSGSAAFITSFTYTPPQDLVGDDTFLYVATDDGTPNRSGTGTITISLIGVNDPPQFIKGDDQNVAEDSDTVSVPWATQILAGPPTATDENDGSQSVSFNVTGDMSLFEIAPTISSDGTLTYKPAANANGTAILSVVATDTGVPSASSTAQPLTISITAVNDAPVFTPGGNVSVAEDSGAYTSPASQPWATSIAPAAGLLAIPQTAIDEAGQIVDFTVSVDRPELFSVQPTVSTGGVLQFTPTENAFGDAVVTVTAVDRGPAGGLNQNSSTPQTFTISLTPVNDAPVGVNDQYSTNENTTLQVPARGLLTNDTDVDLPSDTLTAVPGLIESSFGAAVSISADGSFTYDPSAVLSIQQLTSGQNVLDSFTYQVRDAAGVLSQPATVSINVTGIDDAPVAVDDAYSIGVNQSRLLDVLSNDSDIDSAIDLRTIAITQVPVFGNVIVNQTGVVQYIAGNGFRGVDSFGYTVMDVAGNVSNEAIVTVTVNNAPVANNDTTFTFKNEPVDINVLLNDTDVDGSLDPSTVEVVVTPTPGGTTQVLPNGVIRFTPEAGFAGQAQFSYVVSDDIGTTSNVANVLVRVQNSKWQNPQGSLDVNADGFVSPIDALLLINYLNTGAETFLPSAGVTPPPYLDPSGDEFISPLDVLLVLNFLNERSGGAAEGESNVATTDYAMMVTPEQVLQTVGEEVAREVQSILDESRMEALGSAAPTPNVGRSSLVTDDEEQDANDLVDMLSCSHEEFEKSELEDALDEFFSGIGPIRPV